MNDEYVDLAESWKHPRDVDWTAVTNVFYELIDDALTHYRLYHENEPVYGLVIDAAQNWFCSIHFNTREGVEVALAKYRKNKWYDQSLSDDEVREKIDPWYFDDWKYYSYDWNIYRECSAAGIKPLYELHYDIFEVLLRAECDSDESVSTNVPLSIARAFVRLEGSESLAKLPKTGDFEIRFFNHGRWGSPELLEKARQLG